ncbi:MAG: hypothetical protein SFW36_15055 [Leptolyngbyaceae cyanobacterium bins.59]|nr:hypothetical protein [Leptolyngbyaceae cyanobacterium bins.59]
MEIEAFKEKQIKTAQEKGHQVETCLQGAKSPRYLFFLKLFQQFSDSNLLYSGSSLGFGKFLMI